MQIVSLLFLVGAISFGIIKKINVGLVSIGLALVLGLIGKVGVKTIYEGFPTQLFVTLIGTMLLFSILQENQTLELLSNKIISIVGKRIFLIPIVVYVVSYLLSAAGPGALSVLPISVLLAVSLSNQMEMSPIMMGTLATLGTVGGTVSPIAFTGILVEKLLTSNHVPPIQTQLCVAGLVVTLVFAVIVYLFYKGYKLNSNKQISIGELPKFNLKQKVSLIGLLAMVVSVVGFGMDVGLVSFTIALILIALKTSDERAAIKLIPWGVLMMESFVIVLVNVTQHLGGIKLLANILGSFMNGITAAPIMGLTAGIMAQFSSANGVVMPTLIPVVPEIVAKIGGSTNVHEMIVAIVISSILTMSPLSTAGALIVASYTQGRQVDVKEQNALFGKLFILSFVLLGITVVAILCGLFKLFI